MQLLPAFFGDVLGHPPKYLRAASCAQHFVFRAWRAVRSSRSLRVFSPMFPGMQSCRKTFVWRRCASVS